MKKIIATLLFFLWLYPQPVQAAGYGLHVLKPEEIQSVVQLFAAQGRPHEQPLYVTIPFTWQDQAELPRWQAAFAVAKEHNVIPLVRLATAYDSENKAWLIPNRRQIIESIAALNQLSWPQEQRHVIIYNEPNHAKEWGGQVDPAQFAQVLSFTADWLHTESAKYVVLPGAVDLAAPNGRVTMDGLQFWQRALQSAPDLLTKLDAWNSHSYPNPGFVAAPQRRGQNSLYGFQQELALLRSHTDRQWPVFITETGWRETRQNQYLLDDYYRYAARHIWSDAQIVAVTPFVYKGAPGPFAEFSFVTADDQPTRQWLALTSMMQFTNLLTLRSE